MDMTPAISNLAPHINTTTTTTTMGGLRPIKSPGAGSESPPRIQPSKLISLSNGVLKRHTAQFNLVGGGGVTYKVCLKNHAASLGGHALDGCGEFMPAPSATVVDPASLKCAACGCHRNFHKRELEEVEGSGGAGGAVTQVIEYHPHHRHHPLPPPGTLHHSAPSQPVAACRVQSPGSDNHSPPPISSSYYPGSAPHMLLALSSGGAGVCLEDKSNNNNKTLVQYPNSNHGHLLNHSPNFPSRKRFRTKFSQEQKEKMLDFAEKVGWRMQKSNDEMVNGFCNEIGVERGVFKVWMHNNKNSFAKRYATSTILPLANYGISGTTNQAANEISNAAEDDDEEDEHNNENGNGVVGNNNIHSSSININSHHHHHQPQQQQYNNGRNTLERSTGNGKRSRVDVDLEDDDEGTPTSNQPKRPMCNKAAKKIGKGQNLSYGCVEKLTSTIDNLNTLIMDVIQIEDRRLERERIKANAKLEVLKQRREMQLENMKFDIYLALTNKPMLSDHDIQLKLKLERELGLSCD